MSLYGNYILRKSKTNASDLLKEFIRKDERFNRIPTREDAERLCEELKKEGSWYIANPQDLYDNWVACMK